MDKCTFREKAGAEELCKTMCQPGFDMCPRHKFITDARAEVKDKKEGAKARAIGKALPNTRRALITLGYGFRGNNNCRDCQEPMEWWKTPAGKMAPYNPMPDEDSPALSHFATCKFAANFRKVG